MNGHKNLVARRTTHCRNITCTVYARDDGFLDIEGVLVDTKPFKVVLPERGEIEADDPIHKMELRITIDRSLLIHDVVAKTVNGPYSVCGAINDSYRQLIGLRISSGFTGTVKRLFRTTLGCSHITELLPSIATTAYQAIWGEGIPTSANTITAVNREDEMPSYLGGCHALRLDGDFVKHYFPKWHRTQEERS